MSIDDLSKAIVVKHLTSGDNFWSKLQPVIRTPRNTLLIQYSVSAGGGVRGQKLDYFVILNATNDMSALSEVSHLNIQVVGSTLVRSAAVHESELKGILALAKKGDRRVVNLGDGLVLGQLDIIKQAFPKIFGINNQAKNNLNGAEGDDMLKWKEFGQNIMEFVSRKSINPVVIQDVPYAPAGLTVAALAANLPNTTPSARFEVFQNNVAGIQAKLAERISKLQRGQYIRLVLIPTRENVFIGDREALLTLARSVVTEPKVETGRIPDSPLPLPPTPAQPTAQPVTQPDDVPAAEFQVDKDAPLCLDDFSCRKVWTAIYMQYGAFSKEIETGPRLNQFGAIEYKGASGGVPTHLGVFASAELCDHLGVSPDMTDVEPYPSSILMQKNVAVREKLEQGKLISILKFGKPHLIIFPVDRLPDALRQHIKDPSVQANPKEVAPAPAAPAADKVVVKNGMVDLSGHSALADMKSFGVSGLRLSVSTITDAILSGSGFVLITERSKAIGIAVVNKIALATEWRHMKCVPYGTFDISRKATEAMRCLESGSAIALMRRDAKQFTIFPISRVPQGVAEHISGVTIYTNGHDVLGDAVPPKAEAAPVVVDVVIPPPPSAKPIVASGGVPPQALPQAAPQPSELFADFTVEAKRRLPVPVDLAQRITQRQGEDVVLQRIAEVQKLLNDPNTLAEVRWNGVTLRLTSNPTLIDNVPALADYFKLPVQDMLAKSDDLGIDMSWVTAFEKAATHNGLLVFRSTTDQPPVLMTNQSDFFAKVTREFC